MKYVFLSDSSKLQLVFFLCCSCSIATAMAGYIITIWDTSKKNKLTTAASWSVDLVSSITKLLTTLGYWVLVLCYVVSEPAIWHVAKNYVFLSEPCKYASLKGTTFHFYHFGDNFQIWLLDPRSFDCKDKVFDFCQIFDLR
mgnify:CR=1 FL=1